MSSNNRTFLLEASYPGKPDGIETLLGLAGLAAHFVKKTYCNGARVAYTGMWHVSFTGRYYAGTTEHIDHGKSFESWVALVQKMCHKRETMKESGTWI